LTKALLSLGDCESDFDSEMYIKIEIRNCRKCFPNFDQQKETAFAARDLKRSLNLGEHGEVWRPARKLAKALGAVMVGWGAWQLSATPQVQMGVCRVTMHSVTGHLEPVNESNYASSRVHEDRHILEVWRIEKQIEMAVLCNGIQQAFKKPKADFQSPLGLPSVPRSKAQSDFAIFQSDFALQNNT
jgi:hypothetical protein